MLEARRVGNCELEMFVTLPCGCTYLWTIDMSVDLPARKAVECSCDLLHHLNLTVGVVLTVSTSLVNLTLLPAKGEELNHGQAAGAHK